MPTSPPPRSRLRVLNIDIDNISEEDLLDSFREGVLFTPNIDHLVKLQKNEPFYKAYIEADFRTCDSRIIQLISPFFFTQKIKAQIAGSDFFPNFCHHHSKNEEIKIFILGGSTPEITSKAVEKLNQSAEREIITGAYSPPFGFELDEDENQKIIKQIKLSRANVLAVGVGAPKQELWIQNHKKDLPGVKMFMAVGKTIDFIAGSTQRAPKWMTKVGLEWLYRLGQEPLRLAKRYLVDDMPFFWLAFRQKMGNYSNPWSDK
ncbi:MAG: WecB/TagA/CpsF family glycosyltransferase [Bacteroidia bacterium]|nr:WecB/TagA/CpsF family glycosyltransferase [Bacteroidia bacterium]